jgi:predicted aminopeptidase
VERLGGQRWLATRGRGACRVRVTSAREDFRQLMQRSASACRRCMPARGRRGQAPRKAELMAQWRAEYERMKRERWNGFAGYDGWFARANNAAFGVQAAYNDLVPAFERLFEREGRDFTRFYAEVRRLAALPKDQRRATLQAVP